MTFTPQELHLIRLLSERFDVRELHRLLVGLSDEAPLKARLMEPTSTSPQAFANHALLVLRAAGLVDRALFDALVTERASLAGEIWGVAALFGVSHPDAAPVEPLPEHFAALAEAHAALRTFVGRAEQLALLRAVLLPGPARPASVCSLQGMAGVGKSFLVERFYADHLASFPGGHRKITLGYDAVPTAEGLLSELAERLGVLQGPGRVEERVRGAALATRALVHLDNLDSEEQAQAAAALVRRLSHMPLLLTGRYAFDAELLGWRVVTVAPFEEPEALQQLHRELGEARAKREPEADKQTLVTTLAGLPLAISLAGGVLRSGRSIKTFLDLHSARLLSMKAERAPNTLYLDQSRDELQSLAATFALSIEALREKLGKAAEAGLPAVCALGVAPLVGVRLGWLAAIMGVEEGWAEDWLSDACTLSIVQRDLAAGRWRVHKLLAEYLRGHTDAEAATARMDAWVLERLSEAPDETRGARWGELQAEHEAVAEWVAGLEGERAVVGSWVGFSYAYASGPYTAWLGALARGLDATDDAKARSVLLWYQGNLARQAGELDLTFSAVEAHGALCAAHGWDREVALAAGLRADVLETRGQTDEALRLLREEVLPVFERLGDDRSKATTMDQIADVHQARGHFDEALRIRVEEVLPVFEKIGDLRARANALTRIADVHKARGQLDEALRLWQDEVLPAYEHISDVHSKAVIWSKVADVHKDRGQLDEALRLWRNEVLPAFERLGNIRCKAVTMGQIADIHQIRGQFDEALKIRLQEELPVYERLGDVREKAVAMTKIAEVLQARGQLDDALRVLREQVLPVYELLSDVRGRAVTMGKIANVLYARGQLDDALKIRCEEEIPVYERLGDVRNKAVAMGRIGDIYHAQGRLDDALKIRREEEIPVYERLGDVREKAVAMSKIAEVLQARGQLDEALKIRREEVLPAFEALGDQREVCVGRAHLAFLLLHRGLPADVAEARALLLAAEAAAVEMNLPLELTAIRQRFPRAGLPT